MNYGYVMAVAMTATLAFAVIAQPARPDPADADTNGTSHQREGK